jgi:hypothetical protein
VPILPGSPVRRPYSPRLARRIRGFVASALLTQSEYLYVSTDPERSGKHPVLRNQFRVGAYLKGFPSLKGEEPRHPAVGALFIGGFPLHPAPAGTQMASHHPRSSVVTPEALEETHRNVWLVLKAHGWEPEQEIDNDRR